ncbi:hypothetical protein BP5796_07188 [Coleophoma crateriformis]|uniref:WD40 repeat-like protein n=1 Tax=Coleophoma crateriformis TaxID=565419 RepID=A0A3D8RIG4_9HELO|nr:hypothetical protein BP5796_07188 [Coleophoma crateriformis]
MASQEEAGSSDPITHLCSTVLDLPPSCIEFSLEAPQYFVVGTYNLQREEPGDEGETGDGDEDGVNDRVEKKQQSRDGSLIVFKLDGETLSLIQTESVPSAILDLHFSPHVPSTLCIVTSTGTLSTYSLSPIAATSSEPTTSIDHTLQHISTTQLFSTDTIITSFVFHPSDPELIAVTLTTGAVHLIRNLAPQSPSTSPPTISAPVITHSLEAWHGVFTPPPSQTIYSGGDDAKLRFVTFATLPQTEQDVDDISTAIVAASPPNGYRGHEAGVTFILPVPCTQGEPQLLLTGSYDDHIRLLSHAQNRVQVLSELDLGGGVWRLKFLDPVEPAAEATQGRRYRILASCMHAGTRVLLLSQGPEGDWGFEILGRVEKHKSMNYGSDFQPIMVEGEDEIRDRRVIVSTSFYDRLLCVWRI